MINVDRINRQIGVTMTAEDMATRLSRMCLESEVIDKGKSLRVEIPPTRADILDMCVRYSNVVLVCYIYQGFPTIVDGAC